MKPTLLILAAGMGNRYGGLKQIDPIGPNGEIIIDYSIYDAIRAGFDKLVFIIRHYFEKDFKETIGNKFDGVVETAYAYQELDAALGEFALPSDREKPWGTGHATLLGKDFIDEPFAVINADDYYGINSFKTIADFLYGSEVSPANYAMVGFRLRNTLSEYGSVARGVCHCDGNNYLSDIFERTGVEKHGNGARYFDEDGTEHLLTGDEVVSMNLWGFHQSVFGHISAKFKDFLKEHGNDPKAELYIPTVIDDLVESGKVKVKVLPTHDTWFGVTYRQDRDIAERCMRKLIDKGLYPEKLWET
ncbi:MAG: nucleotidyltransferase family protein [Planctomycetota bacterium]|jgi:dTDP-glucose pyrophosphorylase